jgi:alkylation response protein AidB-like acyl-CoA dehydrogenase
MTGPVAGARAIAEELLFPAAAATDRADAVPVANLNALADAGLYGINAPRALGGAEADWVTLCTVIETLAGACLTTTFVWAQHLSTVPAVAASSTLAGRDGWLRALCTGERRTGVLLPGPLRARRTDGGWLFDGTAPWVSGWGRVDFVHAAASAPGGDVVWALLDARESEYARARRRTLVAINASVTVQLELRGLFVPDDRVTTTRRGARRGGPDTYVLRAQGAYPLGIAARCSRLLGTGPLDGQLERCREAVVRARPSAVPAARAAASELAVRAAAALAVATGSRAVLPDSHAQRLAREALFLLVYGGRPALRDALLAAFGARAPVD